MTLVVIESPYSGKYREANVAYARRALRDSIDRGEAPFASHLLYPQVLDDTKRKLRRLGLSRAFLWYEQAELMAVYMDLGTSAGMTEGLQVARKLGLPVERRWLDK